MREQVSLFEESLLVRSLTVSHMETVTVSRLDNRWNSYINNKNSNSMLVLQPH